MDKPAIVGIIVASLLAGAAGGIGMNWYMGGQDREQTPIAVINVGEVLKQAEVPAGSDASRSEVALEAIRRASDTLTGQGYLVLDQRSVVKAPERLQVDEAMVLETQSEAANGEAPDGEDADSDQE